MTMGTVPHSSWDDLERRLDEFDRAWQSGAAPRIEDFLAEVSGRQELLEELVKIDLEHRWRTGTEKALLESYAARLPDLGPLAQMSANLIAEEYRARLCWGDHPDHQEYRERFRQHGPELSAALRGVDDWYAAERKTPLRPVDVVPDTIAEVPTLQENAPDSVSALVGSLRDLQLLTPHQQVLLSELAVRFPEPHALARELLARDWLSAYQVNQLLRGRASDLVMGPYLLLERLGEGGTGWVFKARHQHMKRLVALKVLRRELLADVEVLARFYREIQVVSQLDHPHIVHAYDAGPIRQAHVLVMEYAPGVDLARAVKRRGPLPIEDACDCIRQAAVALQYIYEKGLVHRDVKPSNLLLTSKPGPGPGLLKVLDLGLSRLGKVEPEGEIPDRIKNASSARLTPDGALVVGTPDYLAPEQALDFHAADTRADIYSLGCTFFYLLTGKPPFPGGTLARKLLRHQEEAPPALRPHRPDVPPGLEALIHQMLAKDPARRQQVPLDVVAALEALGFRPRDSLSSIEIAEATVAEPMSTLSMPGVAVPPIPEPVSEYREVTIWERLALPLVGLVAALGLFVVALALTWRPPPPTITAKVHPRPLGPQPIPSLFSTGMTANHRPLADGQVDPHWSLVATPASVKESPAFTTMAGFPVTGPWVSNSLAGRWISPQPRETGGDPPGKYIYRTTFDLNNFDPASARLRLQIAVDNGLEDVRLNDTKMGYTIAAPNGFQMHSSFEIRHGFRAGLNVLELMTVNSGDTLSPSGVQVLLSGTAVPAVSEETEERR
jgi:serine/threonine protein kinase